VSRVSWQFYSKRRKARLEVFLRDVKTIQGALDKFTRLKIVPPVDLINKFFNPPQPSHLSLSSVFDDEAPDTSGGLIEEDQGDATNETKSVSHENQDSTKYDELVIIEGTTPLDD